MGMGGHFLWVGGGGRDRWKYILGGYGWVEASVGYVGVSGGGQSF